MASFPIYRDETADEPTAIVSAVRGAVSRPTSSKEPRSGPLQMTSQKAPKALKPSKSVGNLRSKSTVKADPPASFHPTQIAGASSSRSISARSASVAASRFSMHDRLHAKEIRQKELEIRINALLDEHPEDFADIPERGREPDFEEEAEKWIYPKQIADQEYDATMEHPDFDQCFAFHLKIQIP